MRNSTTKKFLSLIKSRKTLSHIRKAKTRSTLGR